ncbi:MAG TPA: DUF4333 domain-containing protein [Thermoanaerobaculia bacterium]|nr:DUF4333 domain-containing protein [Thermoanaerobaculia bacterium]
MSQARGSTGPWISLTLAGALLAGCQQRLDMDRLSEIVSHGITEQMGLEVTSVECPEGVMIEAGNTFECTAQAEGGGVLQVEIEQEDDEGNVTWKVVAMEGILDLELLVGQIQSGLAEQAQMEASVDCGGRFRAAEAGDAFQCAVTDAAGNEGTITVTVTDDQGNVSWAVD